MLEVFQDSTLQFIAIILVSALAIAVTIILFLVQRSRKTISYEIVSQTPILTHREELKGRLTVQFDGQVVPNVKILILKIINTGNVPIATSDFETPIQVSFGSDVQVLSAEVTETYPEGLNVPLNYESECVIINPFLLNKGDSITLKILSTQSGSKLTIDGRIIGVSSIQRLKESMWSIILTRGCRSGNNWWHCTWNTGWQT